MQDTHAHACYVAYDVTHIWYSCTSGQNCTVLWRKTFDKRLVLKLQSEYVKQLDKFHRYSTFLLLRDSNFLN